MLRPRIAVVVAAAATVAFGAQFAILDASLRGPRAWLGSASAAASVVASLLVWTALLAIARARAARVGVALLAAILLVVQVFVFRYYRTPLDVQVAASALHAWRDVGPVVARAMPYVAVAVVVAAAAELALLEAAHRHLVLPRGRRARAALALATVAALVVLSPRQATPDLRGLHALTAVAHARGPRAEARRAEALPPIYSDRDTLPNVLFILSESVRADDYVEDGPRATASATSAALAPSSRASLRQMRAVASYTALSVSALFTGRSQEGPREEVLASPSLFDFARATVDARGRRPFVAYYGAQSEDVFEARSVVGGVDRFVSVEALLGRSVGDDSSLDGLPLDRMIVDRLLADLPAIPAGSVVVLHLYGTHAPYYFEERNAAFVPFGRIVSWSRMEELRNASRNAIAEQDRQVSRAVRAFVEHSDGAPWFVAFTSDHGEAFGEHGAIHHGQSLYDEQIHVPAWSSSGAGALDAQEEDALRAHADRFVTHLDVLPTLLDVLGVWDNLAVRPARAAMRGKSLLRPWEPRAPIPLTNCTAMFPCPLDTAGVLGDGRALVAQAWDASWICLALVGAEAGAPKPDDDPGCVELRAASRRHFGRLPNGQPNR